MVAASFRCAYCGCPASKEAQAVNRARRVGYALYCDRACAGKARRKGKTAAERKAEKSAYDLARRNGPLRNAILAKKRQHYKDTYDPVKAAVYRKKRMPYHVEYCRRPEYRKKKKAFDRVYRAKKDYGPLWEVQLLRLAIREAVLERQTDYQIRLSKGGLSKSQKRKRAYDQVQRNTLGQVPQGGSLADLERRQGRQDGSRAS